METISKAELARQLNVTKPRITQLIAGKMPGVQPDGSIDRQKALAWIVKYKSSSKGGHTVRGRRDIHSIAQELLSQGKQVKPAKSSTTKQEPSPPPPPAKRPLANFLGQPISSFSGDEAVRLQTHAEISAQLTSAAAQADFFRVCRQHIGLSAREAYLVASWYVQVLIHVLDVEDLDGEPDWKELIGADDDVDEYFAAYDKIAAVECVPPAETSR